MISLDLLFYNNQYILKYALSINMLIFFILLRTYFLHNEICYIAYTYYYNVQ